MESVLSHLEARGYQIARDGTRARIVAEARKGGKTGDAAPISGGWRRFGVVSDTHLASRHARLDVLEHAYDHFAEEKITTGYHCGNLVDGEASFNRYELLAHGITDQALYVLDHYPQRSGITTYYISGECHEGWWRGREGIDFGRYLQFEARDRGRNDLQYLGFMEADVRFDGPVAGHSYVRLLHPGGGTAYAISYATQKIVESLQGGEKPAMILCGHYHKMITHDVRNVTVIQAGCTQDQTGFMRKRKLEAHLGYWTVAVKQDSKGAIRRVQTEKTQFFDRGYHEVSRFGEEVEQ